VKPIVRNALATLAGFIASNATMLGVTLLNLWLYPDLMRAVEADDPALIQAEAAKPGASGALVVVLVAWLVAGAVGGFLATRLAAARSRVPALLVGGLMTVGAVINNLTYPPPLWFWILTPFAFLPTAMLAASRASRPAP